MTPAENITRLEKALANNESAAAFYAAKVAAGEVPEPPEFPTWFAHMAESHSRTAAELKRELAALRPTPLAKRHLRDFPDYDQSLVKAWRGLDEKSKSFSLRRLRDELGKYLSASRRDELDLLDLAQTYREDFAGDGLAALLTPEQLLAVRQRILARVQLQHRFPEAGIIDPFGDEHFQSATLGRVLAALDRHAGKPLTAMQANFPKFQPAEKSKPMSKKPSKKSAAPAPGAELVMHEFGEDGRCVNPEVITIALPNDLKASVMLGMVADGSWRVGHDINAKDGDDIFPCKLEGNPHADRMAAFSAGIEEILWVLKGAKDTPAIRAVEAFAKSFGDTPLAAVVEKRASSETIHALGALPKGKFAEIPIAAIQANPDNPRKFFEAMAMRELADSIATQGLLQPIAIRRMLPEELGEDPAIAAACPPERYELILGERRWRAAQMPHRDVSGQIVAGTFTLEAIEAKVYEGVTRAQGKAAALVENLQREKMNPIEEAEGYRDLIASQTPPLTQDQAAAIVGKSRPVVANALRVLELPVSIVELIRDGKLTLAHGVALARFKAWPRVVEMMARAAVENGWHASQLEKGVPCRYDLCRAELAIHFNNWDNPKPSAALVKKHPAYFSDGDGGSVCLDLEHWKGELARIAEEKRIEDEKAAAKLAAAAKKAEKGGKLKNLNDLKLGDYKEFKGVSAGLVDLMPEAGRATVKDHGDKQVEIATDVALAERLEAALKREIKKDRRSRVEPLEADVRAYLGKLKKLGSREMAMLYAELVTYPGHSHHKQFTSEACKAAGVKQPAAFREDDLGWDAEDGSPEDGKGKMPQLMRELRALERLDSVVSFRVLAEERLAEALEAMVEHGPMTPSALFIKWMLDRDELGLLEETDEGKGMLFERVKAAKWYQSEVVAGVPAAAGEDAA